MKTYRVRLKREWVEWHETTVEAENEKEALNQANGWALNIPEPNIAVLRISDQTLTIDGALVV